MPPVRTTEACGCQAWEAHRANRAPQLLGRAKGDVPVRLQLRHQPQDSVARRLPLHQLVLSRNSAMHAAVI
jgi:hypothetical protein